MRTCFSPRWIPLTHGKCALVDEPDAAALARLRWWAFKRGNCWHAARTVKRNGTKRTVYMHRLLIEAPPGREVDHENGDGLDNRRSNIRLCTKRQNGQNRRQVGNRHKSSRFHGVCFKRQFGKWDATICAGPVNARGHAKQIYIGRFTSEEAAAHAYDAAARWHFGPFAALNFPQDHA